jgi:hypothetical protein
MRMLMRSGCRHRCPNTRHRLAPARDLDVNQIRGTLPSTWSSLNMLQSLCALAPHRLPRLLLVHGASHSAQDPLAQCQRMPACFSSSIRLQPCRAAACAFCLPSVMPQVHRALLCAGRYLEGNKISGTLPSSWSSMTALQTMCALAPRCLPCPPSPLDASPGSPGP